MFSEHLNTLPRGSRRAPVIACNLGTTFGAGVNAEEMPSQRRPLAAGRHWGECLNPEGPRGAWNSVY